jgi:hypothetical protein
VLALVAVVAGKRGSDRRWSTGLFFVAGGAFALAGVICLWASQSSPRAEWVGVWALICLPLAIMTSLLRPR